MDVVSLEYHDVVPSGEWDSSGFAGAGPAHYKLTVENARAHFAALQKDASVSPWTVTDVLRGALFRLPPVLLTFDDGGVSAHDRIAGMLEEYGWRGHFFVTVDRIDTPGFMTRDQIRAMHARGHVIGSHTCSHPTRMASCSYEQMLDEWGRSLRALSDLLGAPVTTGSVPGGYFKPLVARAAAASGMKVLFNSEPVKRVEQIDGCAVLGRFGLFRSDPPAQSVALSSIPLSAAQARQYAVWNAKKLVKAVGGKYYLALRQQLLQRFGANA